MNRLKSAAAGIALAAATFASGAACAYPIVVAAPAPVVVAPAYAGAYYLHPRWVGGVYYRYPYFYHGVRYFGPRPGWGWHYRYWGRRWR